MKAIQKSKCAVLFDMCESDLRACARVFHKELSALKQKGNKYNYKVVLFLAYKQGVDLKEVYPNEDKDAMLREQEAIMQSLYGNDKSLW